MEEERLIQGEANKFLPIDKVDLYGDSIGYVELYDSSHANESEAQRVWTVTQICSLAYGNESAKSPEALYERMKSIKHESLWEFIRHGKIGYTIRGSMRNGADQYDTCMPHQRADEWAISHKNNVACFRIKVPLFIRAQFMRHRSFSYLEISRRYTKGAKVPFEFWFPNDFPQYARDNWSRHWMQDYEDMGEYETQVASRFLPQTTYTEFYMMGEVEGLRNFFQLRLDSHSQEQIRELAEAMLALLVQHQPELANKVIV